MKYYSLLKTKEKAKPELLDMPIIALGLKPAVFCEIGKYKQTKNGKVDNKFTTIRDLLEYGKNELMVLMSTSKPRYDVLLDNIYHIEERLAKIGLRFNDTEFTIGDVRISELKVNEEAKDLLKRMGWGSKLKTLDDLIVINYEYLENVFKEGDKKTLKKIEKAVGKYGLKVEDSHYRPNKNEFFPLDDYVEYLPKEFLEGRLNAKVKSSSVQLDFSKMSQEEILKSPILSLNLFKSNLFKTLGDMGISTIGDLVNFDERKLRKYVSSSQVGQLQDRLALLNLTMKNSSIKIINGVTVPISAKNKCYNGINVDIAPKFIDVQSLNDEEKQKFFNIKIEDFGFTDGILIGLKKTGKYKTIGDVLSAERMTLLHDSSQHIVQTLVKTFALYNLTLNNAKELVKGKYFKATLNEKNVTQMNEEDKSKFLKLSLKEVGFTSFAISYIQKINKNIQTVGDLCNCTRKELLSVSNDSVCIGIRNALNHYGLSLKKERGNINKKKRTSTWTIRDIKDFELKPENRDRLLAKGVESLGLRVRVVEKLKSNGVCTIGELIALRKMEAVNKLNKNIQHANEVQENLRSIGLDFVPLSRKLEKNNNERGVKKVYSEKKIIESDLLPENRDKLLSKPVEDLGLNMLLIKKLKDSNVFTIADLQKISPTKLRVQIFKSYSKYFEEVVESLKSVGLQLSKVRESGSKFSERKIEYEDLLLENRQKLREKPIEDLGLRFIIINRLKDAGVEKISDIENLTPTNLRKNVLKKVPSHYDEVKKALTAIGLSLKQREKVVKVQKTKTQDNVVTTRNIKTSDLLPENKDKLLSKPIEDLGIKQRIVKKLKDNNVITIGDLISHSATEVLVKIFGYYTVPYKELVLSLKQTGLSFKQGYNKKSKEIKQPQKEEISNTDKPALAFGKDKELAEFVTMDDYKVQTKVEEKASIKTQESQKTINSFFDLNETQINELNILRDNLRVKGIWALYEIDKLYFASCSKELEAIKEIMREYFDEKFNVLIMGAKNETLLENAIKTLKSASSTFETIIEQKQAELRVERDGLLKKKVETANGLRSSIFKMLDKYHHNPTMHNAFNKDIKAQNKNLINEDER